MKKYFVIVVLGVMLCTGCIKDVDFDQVYDIEIYTDHNVSLVYFNLEVNDFLDDLNNETVFISDTVRLPVFAGPYNEKYLVQADFQFRLSNSFSRSVSIEYNFLDEFNNLLHIFDPISTTPFSEDLDITRTISESEIPGVLLTDKIVINILMATGGALDPLSDENFNVESAVLLHYKVTVEDE